jgi:hypothetical protein
MQTLLAGAEFDVVPVTADQARRIAAAHGNGEGAPKRRVSISATALLTTWPRPTIARCCMSDKISPKWTSKARSKKHDNRRLLRCLERLPAGLGCPNLVQLVLDMT